MTSTRPSQPNAIAEVQEVLQPLETTPVLPAETEASGSGATSQNMSNAATSEEQQSSESLEIVFSVSV